jgi:hypothetical protein
MTATAAKSNGHPSVFAYRGVTWSGSKGVALQTLIDVLEYVDLVAFVALAIVTFRIWKQRRDEASRWTALTFASLAVVVIAGEVIPEESDSATVDFAETILIAVLLLFPYLLFRLASSFSERRRGWPELGAALLTAAVVVWAIALPSFPDEGEPRSTAFQVFIFAVLVQWVVLSAFVAVRFWRAGSGQPDVARRRMRMLSVAATGMSIAIVISGSSAEREPAVDLFVQLVVMTSVVSFFLAFAPPTWLRWMWRRGAERELRKATSRLMAATNREDVVGSVLPHATAMVGGQGIAMYDTASNRLGDFGFTEAELIGLDTSLGDLPPEYHELNYDFGSMILRAGPHTPFFGEDDINLLGALGTFVNLAMQRLDTIEVERQLAEARIRRRQALEINDNVVQRLAVAHYSFELGQIEEGKKAMHAALRAARQTISDLLDELPPEQQTDASTLTRTAPATDFSSDG